MSVVILLSLTVFEVYNGRKPSIYNGLWLICF